MRRAWRRACWDRRASPQAGVAAPRAPLGLGAACSTRSPSPDFCRRRDPSRPPARRSSSRRRRRSPCGATALARVGGFDPEFHPAWFEDVDLAKRLQQAGLVLRYWPAARFRHRLGSTVPRLGYGPFLFLYYRNLTRYLAKHHGRGWAWAARAALIPGIAVRLLALPFRRPRRAASRREALAGLLAVLAGALSGWTRPRRLAEGSALKARGGRRLHRHPRLRGRPAGVPGVDRRPAPPAARDRGGRLREPRRQPGDGAGARPGRPLESRSRRSAWPRTWASRAG